MRLLLFFLTYLTLTTASDLSAQSNLDNIDALAEEAFLLQNSYPDSAFLVAKKVLSLSKLTHYQKGMGAAHMRLGSIYELHKNFDSAVFHLNRCYQIRLQMKDYSGAAGACYVLNDAYEQAAMLDSAFFTAYRGLRLAEKHHLERAYADFLFELGELNLNYKESDTAFYYFKKAFDLGASLNDKVYNLKVAFGLGAYYYTVGNFEKALDYYLVGNELIDPVTNKIAVAISANNLAACYDQLDRPKEAKKKYQTAVSIYQELSYPAEAAESMNSLGALYFRNEAYDSAEYWYAKAYPILKSTDSYNSLLNNLLFRSVVCEAKGKNLEALAFYKEYTNYKDSLLDTQKISSIAEMQTKYDTEKKEQQILLLDEQNKTKAAQRNVFIAGTMVLFLGLFILGFYYRQRVKLNKKDKQLAQERINTMLNMQEAKSYTAMLQGQEEERQRIASDLHDRLGGMLSTTKLLLAASDLKSEQASTQVQRATELIDEAVKEVRRVSHNLSTGMVQSFGLLGALEDLADSMNQSKLIKCTVNAYGIDERLETALEIDVYRMIQETVNNVLKHAKASRLDIQLNHLEDSLSISIEDNGMGFNPKALGKRGGIGLSNLQARAGKYGGDCIIDSHIGKGTMVIIDIPLKETD